MPKFPTNALMIVAATAAGGLGGSAIAGAASPSKSSTNTTAKSAQHQRSNPNETALTGDTLKSASDAAIAANPGATVDNASTEDPAENTGAAYEVHITKKDGTRAEVLEDSSFKVLTTKTQTGHGGHGGRHGGGNPNEKALAGDTKTQAEAAALAANSGATVQNSATEDPAENTGAAYEVHITKKDGAHAEVLEDSSFKVMKTTTMQGHR